MAGDVEEAVRQGCADNSLRLALGQEPERPLFLLGKLGDTDVRVVRKGDDIEVRLGESVRETIRVGYGQTGVDTQTPSASSHNPEAQTNVGPHG